MQNPNTCPACGQELTSPHDAVRRGCPRCQPRPRALRRGLQMVLVLGLLIATTGAAGLFAFTGCPCSPVISRPLPEELPKNLSNEEVPAGPPDVKGGQPPQPQR
jgi:hypothetical protein